MATQKSHGKKLSRRELFYQWGVAALGGVFSVLVGIPLIGYVVSGMFNKTSEQWVPVCTLDQINWDQPTEFTIAFNGENAHRDYQEVRGVFVIRKGSDILAFTNICTHMGCSTRWLAWRQQILCPCHGGVYDRWGNLMGGPPAHSLPFYVSRVDGNTLYVANRYQERS